MAPLPQNNTNRYFLDYVTGNHATAAEHTMAIRTRPGVEHSQVDTFFLDMLNAITAVRFWGGWRPLRLRFQLANTSFSVPVDMSAALEAFVGNANSSGITDMTDAIEYTFQGRSHTTGRRVDFSLYGLAIASIAKPRYLPSDGLVPWLSGLLSGLNGEASLPVCIDGTTPTWYRYLNANYNSYWESRARR